MCPDTEPVHNQNNGYGKPEQNPAKKPFLNSETLEEMARISQRIMNVRAKLAKIMVNPLPAPEARYLLIYEKDSKTYSSAFSTLNEAVDFGAWATEDDELFAMCVIDKKLQTIVWNHFFTDERELKRRIPEFLRITPSSS